MFEGRKMKNDWEKDVHIDETFCNGCGGCIPKRAEGTLQIVSDKARIVNDSTAMDLAHALDIVLKVQ